MPTARPDPESATPGRAFVVWFTGLPASGKSTIAVELLRQLEARGVRCARLESDALRQVMRGLDYSEAGRNTFYRTLAWIATLLVDHGIPVVIDATANRRRYRDEVRRSVGDFIEVHVDTPLAVCKERDPKGLYRRSAVDVFNELPGSGSGYEPPLEPELTVSGIDEDPHRAAGRIIAVLAAKGLV